MQRTTFFGSNHVASVARGAYLCVASFGLFTLQDAAIKWLVVEHSVIEVLFWRSVTILVICYSHGGKDLYVQSMASPALWKLVGRALVAGAAWLLYYTASRTVSLAQMTTLYFSAPIIVTVLSSVLLKERTGLYRWGIVILGFVGVVIASRPTGEIALTSTLMILAAAALWAYGLILLRSQAMLASITQQVVITNVVYLAMMLPALPWVWSAQILNEVVAMLAIGVIGGAAQYLAFSSYRYAPASILAPFEYTGLIWAFLLSWLIWGETPDTGLIAGAVLIAISGVAGLYAAITQRSQNEVP